MSEDKQVEREKSQKTRERILAAAERLFANKGFAGASMRSITAEAKVNLSVAYYYFESKEALLVAVLEKYIVPVVERERELLAEARAAAGTDPIPLRTLVEAAISVRLEERADHENVRQLMLILSANVGAIGRQIYSHMLDKVVKETREKFEEEFSKTCPELSIEELRFRLANLNVLLAGWKTVSPFFKEKARSPDSKISSKTYKEWFILSIVQVFKMPPVGGNAT